MKRAELEKHLGNKIVERMRKERTPDRYGNESAASGGRRAQRERDQAAGLVPFAVKLPSDLVASLQALAQSRGTTLNALAAELLRKALDTGER